MDILKDIRLNKKTEFGNIVEVSGDHSLGFFGTDKGYRLVLSTYNMKRISDHYNKDNMKEAKSECNR